MSLLSPPTLMTQINSSVKQVFSKENGHEWTESCGRRGLSSWGECPLLKEQRLLQRPVLPRASVNRLCFHPAPSQAGIEDHACRL